MDELIRREDVFKLIDELESSPYACRNDGFAHAVNDALEIVRHFTKHDIPAVDAVEVKHGTWVDKGSLSCRCSECGCKNTKETRYCPNCGARMDGGKDG